MTQIESLPQALIQAREPLSWSNLTDPRYLIEVGLKLALIVGLAWVSFRILSIMLRRIERSAEDANPGAVSLHEQRIVTITSLIRSVGTVVIMLITAFMVLQVLDLPISPLLGSAAVIGLAVSFGSQALVKDIISGLFILFEDQFGIGDVIRVSDVSGRVEKITLRIVVLRDLHGALHVVPNGEITRVSNLTRGYARAVIEIGVAYSEDVDQVMAVMRDVGQIFWIDNEWRPFLTEEPTVPGIESFGEAGVNIRMLATTLPLKQWDVARELRRRLKVRFDHEAIAIPFTLRTVTVHAAPKGDEGISS